MRARINRGRGHPGKFRMRGAHVHQEGVHVQEREIGACVHLQSGATISTAAREQQTLGTYGGQLWRTSIEAERLGAMG